MKRSRYTEEQIIASVRNQRMRFDPALTRLLKATPLLLPYRRLTRRDTSTSVFRTLLDSKCNPGS
jgi:hypothetical protein